MIINAAVAKILKKPLLASPTNLSYSFETSYFTSIISARNGNSKSFASAYAFKTIFIALLLSVFAVSSGFADDQSNSLCSDVSPSADTLLLAQYCGSKASAQVQKDVDKERLLEKASNGSRVRVIAKIKAPFIPEGLFMTEEKRLLQRLSIKERQEEYIKRHVGSAISKTRLYDYIPFVAMEADYKALEALIQDPLTESIREDKLSMPMLAQTVPLVQGNQAWEAGYSGSGQAVAILDTGVEKVHPFLLNKVVDEACYSSGETTLCPNNSISQVGEGAGVNCSGISTCMHGSHVAGIAAGSGSSFSGVAKDAKIISIQVFSRSDSPYICESQGAPCLSSYDSDQISALERVYSLRNTHRIASVNMSLGGSYHNSYCDSEKEGIKAVIDNLRSVGIATIIAAGNDGYTDAISAPGCISTAISVGSVTKSDAVATSYSNSASFLSILAPGSNVYSSVLNGQFGYSTGTSMATPHVAGAWAVLKQKSPSASVNQILTALQNTGTPITDRRNGITKPRINVFSALNYLSVPVYRFYNTQAGGHFFTISEAERDYVRNNLRHFNYEGAGFYAHSGPQGGVVPVYRFYNTQAGGHFFTVSEAERDYVRNNLRHFNYEGAGFYAYSGPQGGVVPVYRFYNTQAVGHFFAVSEAERDYVRNNLRHFNYEGAGFYAFP